MLQLTKRTEYGLIALVSMAERPGEYVSVREISEHYRVPRRLLAEVLKDLSRTRLVESQRGAGGGYTLGRSAEDVTVGEVVATLEGVPSLSSCENPIAPRGGECDLEHVCPIRSPLQTLREGIWHLMEQTTLRSLVDSSRRPTARRSLGSHRAHHRAPHHEGLPEPSIAGREAQVPAPEISR